MNDGIGYLLPPGDVSTEDTECLIVFVPARDEYRRALFGSLDYLATWLAWERDDDKRGKDAAALWKAANDATRDCYDMNTCQTIIDLLTEIRDGQCACSGGLTGNTTYNENTVITTVITPWQNPVPAAWGEQSIADWDEWSEYVCGAAHVYVDDLIETVGRFQLLAGIGGLTLDFIAHVYSLLNWRYILDVIPVNWDLVFSIVDSIGEGLLAVDFTAVSSNIESSRDDIVCALFLGEDLETAVYDAVNDAVLWDWFFTHLNYENTAAVIYRGEAGTGQYLTPIQRNDCLCGSPYGCENSLLNDCGFESAGLNDGWQKTAEANMPVWDTDSYVGTYALRLVGGSGWPLEYIWQEFTAEVTGQHDVRFWNKRYTGTYSTQIAIDRWTGSAWTEINAYPMDFENAWSYAYHTTNLTAGTLYRMRIGNGGYHLVDQIKVWPS